jgi:uncharacterized linocin/CFP29 family protein
MTHPPTHPAHDRAEVPWNEEVWERLDAAVRHETTRTRIAAKFLPAACVPSKTLTIPSVGVAYPNTPATPGGPTPQAGALSSDEGATTRMNEYWVEFVLTPAQVEHEVHAEATPANNEDSVSSAAVMLAIRAANLLALAEDTVIFQGSNAFSSPLFAAPPTGSIINNRGVPADLGLLNIKLPVGGQPQPPPSLNPNQIITVHPVSTAVQPPPYQGNTVAAVEQAVSVLQSYGQYGPYALVLSTHPYADAYSPLPSTLILPADPIPELVTAGFFGSATLPPWMSAENGTFGLPPGQQQVTSGGGPPVPSAALADAIIASTGSVTLNSGTLVDSYQSSQGAYGGSNIGTSGAIQAATSIVNNGGVVHGSQTQNSPANLPIVPVPAGAQNLPLGSSSPGSLNINDASSSITLAPGNYVAANINVNFPGAITISPAGPVAIWVTGSLNLGGNENPNGVPANLTFLVTSAGSVNVNSNGQLFGVIYAPTSGINLNSPVFGAVIGSTVTLNSGSAVHFDQGLPASQVTTSTDAVLYTGVVVSLGGNTMELTRGNDAALRFEQRDVNGNYRFRVMQRFALRLKDPTAVVLLEFMAS